MFFEKIEPMTQITRTLDQVFRFTLDAPNQGIDWIRQKVTILQEQPLIDNQQQQQALQVDNLSQNVPLMPRPSTSQDRPEVSLQIAKAEADKVVEVLPNIEKDFLVEYIQEYRFDAEGIIHQLIDGTIQAPKKHSLVRNNDIKMHLTYDKKGADFLVYEIYAENPDYQEDLETMFVCPICTDIKSMTKSIQCKSMARENEEDEHWFCIDCVRGYGEASVSEPNLADGGEGLRCMHPGCKRILKHAAVISCIPEDQKQTRSLLEKRFATAAMIASGIQYEECHFCSYAEIIEEPPEVNKVFDCVGCEAKFCRICKEAWGFHIGKKCQEVADEKKTTAEERARMKLEEALSKLSIRYCQHCNIAFEKEEGCNKMTCRCGRFQCYLCNEPVKDYKHFCQHTTDPQLPGVCPQNCGKCMLWANPKTQEVEARKKLINSYRGQISDDKLRLLY